MKKIYVIVGLLVLMASCQKEVIRPNECPTQSPTEKRGTTGTDADGNPTTGGGGIETTDPDNTTNGTEPSEEDNDITDPMRKNDRKGSK